MPQATLEEDKAVLQVEVMKAAIDVSEKLNIFYRKKRYFDQNSVHVPLFHSLEDLHLSQILKKYHLSTLDLMFSFLVQFQGRNGTFGDLGPRVDALHQASLKEMIFWQIFI